MTSIVVRIERLIKAGTLDPGSMVQILSAAAKEARGYPDPGEALAEALEVIGAGQDGIRGTEDDLIPPDIVAKCKELAKTAGVRDVASVMVARGAMCWACS